MVGGDAMRDAQAGVPSTGWLRAQLAFKNSMVHGILQFTPSIAFCYVLHRCVSRDIRCRESFVIQSRPRQACTPRTGHDKTSPSQFMFSLAHSVPGFVIPTRHQWCPKRDTTFARQGGFEDQDQSQSPHHPVVFTNSRVVLLSRVRQ